MSFPRRMSSRSGMYYSRVGASATHRSIVASVRGRCSNPGIRPFTTGPHMAIFVNERISLADDEVTEQFVRSPGPGGQNVNKLATAVQLRFDARGSKSLPEDVCGRVCWSLRGRVRPETRRDRHRCPSVPYQGAQPGGCAGTARCAGTPGRGGGEAAQAHAAERSVEAAPAGGQAPALSGQACAPAPRPRHRGMNRR